MALHPLFGISTLNLTLIAFVFLLTATPTAAFGAGFVARGSAQRGTAFRHGDILLAVPFLASANRSLVKKIYFGNWLRDFSQLLDSKSIALVPEPLLRAVVAVFGVLQFGYSTRGFEVTKERLGLYRPEEHIDNPRGYDGGGGIVPGLHHPVHPLEYDIDTTTGMKNYIANQERMSATSDDTSSSARYIEAQIVAAIACGRNRDPEAYLHLGAALHTLEDFVAHSNWIELCMQMIGRELVDQPSLRLPALANVFPFVGDGIQVRTQRGRAVPLVTGTFGALDLYQTLLGEIDDKLSAMSLPGLQMRTAERGGALQGVVKQLIGLMNGAGSSGFDMDILKISKAASDPRPADWGKLTEVPELLWEQLEPVFRLRDDIVHWVYDHLTIKAVQDAIAAISTSIDKLVYLVLGIFLGPVLAEISKALQEQEEQLMVQDRMARAAKGELSIFEPGSFASDPTHSQLSKDHYDNELNELAGRVATVITSFTITAIASVWQPSDVTAIPHQDQDIHRVLSNIMSALHHPYNATRSPETELHSLMFTEVFEYCSTRFHSDPVGFEEMLVRLDKSHMAASRGEGTAHSHARHREFNEALTAAHTDGEKQIGLTTAHNLTTVDRPYVHTGLVERITQNLSQGVEGGLIPGLKLDAIPGIKKLLLAPPSGAAPNPLDVGLSNIGGVGLMAAFKGVETGEIATTRGIGEVLRDAVITMRMMEEEKESEKGESGVDEVGLAGGVGWTKTKIREMQKLLEVERPVRNSQTAADEGQGRGQAETEDKTKASTMDKLKVGLMKMKMKAGSGS